MKWLYRHLHKKEKGFTLVELMVVIIILAVLTAIAIPSYMALRNRARIQATRSEMQNIGTAIAIYEADTSGFPATGLAALTSALETTPAGAEGPYMANVPQTDAWGVLPANAYVYVLVAAGGVSYTLTSSAGGGTAIVLTDGQLN